MQRKMNINVGYDNSDKEAKGLKQCFVERGVVESLMCTPDR